MTDPSGPAAPDRLPPSAWALGWVCLAGQVLALAERGFSRSDLPWVLVSMVLTAFVVGWVSTGVLRARTVRLVLVWLLFAAELVLAVIGTLFALTDPLGTALLDLAVAVAQVVTLAVFSTTAYFRRQREGATPGTQPDIAGLVLVAVLVGGLGGLTAPGSGPNPPVQVRVGL